MNVEAILKSTFPAEVVDAMLAAYKEVESNFVLGNWKASELDSGHFVEAARRCLELKLLGVSTPISASLPNFSDSVLKQYENAQGDESFRLLIPRVLKSIYNIRNKRGVGHLGAVSPNEMDSTLILYSAKWVLAELVRLSGGGSPDETQSAVNQIVERRLSALWKHAGPTRVLVKAMKARDQVLVLLYDKSPQSIAELQASIEYKKLPEFKKILLALHKERLIEVSDVGSCAVTTNGVMAAEALLTKVRNNSKG